MEAAQVSINRLMDKTTMGYLHNGILLSLKKDKNFTFYDSMDGPGKHYAQWNKLDKFHMFHLHVEFNEQTELTSKAETDS